MTACHLEIDLKLTRVVSYRILIFKGCSGFYLLGDSMAGPESVLSVYMVSNSYKIKVSLACFHD